RRLVERAEIRVLATAIAGHHRGPRIRSATEVRIDARFGERIETRYRRFEILGVHPELARELAERWSAHDELFRELHRRQERPERVLLAEVLIEDEKRREVRHGLRRARPFPRFRQVVAIERLIRESPPVRVDPDGVRRTAFP